ncbi:glutathione S-transferase [Myxococcus stipitatus DSM 14675]|uniref:Glutathione S-transferase n=1 Tax=Myxococcus stipitatus (strain DSM 14675 / JCM 12634 / Mx s8) TaxID=1278073 RepID=L7UMU4_MYXSD|nr:glutathione S-transferase family protein [Myxococcus stipitatus]AGC47789.1 glutathione S-transferase [Myxococcus stipitatus DSM 14675]
MRLYDYAPSANGYKIRLLLSWLDKSYELVPVDIFSGESHTDDFLRHKNPHGRIPVLEPEPGRFLAESNAIILFLAEGTPLLPEDRFERAHVHQWLFFEQNALEPNLGTARFWKLTGRAALNPEAFRLRLEAARNALQAMERHLAHHPFFVGERPTVADIGLYGFGHVAADAGINLGDFPAVSAWLARMKAIPGHIGALAPYTANAHVTPS